MKSPVPKSLTGAVPPIQLFSWVFGIGVIEYPIGVPRPVISVLWSIVHFLIYIAFLWMANFSEIVTFHGSTLAAYNYRINAYLCAAFIPFSMFLAQSRVKVVYNYSHKIDAMNDKLKILGVPNHFEMTFKIQLIRISVAIVFTSIMMVLAFKCVRFDLPSEWSRFGFLMTAHYLLMFSSIIDGNCIFGLGYLANRFERLNKLLVESDSTERRKMKVVQEFDDEFQRYSSVISENYQNNSLATRAAEKQWLLYVIRETRIIHRGLCKLAMTLNRACGIQVLFSVAMSFSTITAVFYTSYDISRSSSMSDFLYNNWAPKIVTMMWIIYCAMKVILIVHACDTTSFEANRTRGFVNKLLGTAACDQDVRDEIDTFSLQLLQNPLNFTANGFFTLDYSLVHRMIGSVTTNLIIMIQMKSMYEPMILNFTTNSTIPIQTNGTD